MSLGPRGGPSSGAQFDIHLTFFLNARHRVPLGHEEAPVHSHSWRLEVSLSAAFKEGRDLPPVEFAELEVRISSLLRPYEGGYLNDLPPFHRHIPTTENLARFYFGAISDVLEPLAVAVKEVSLWEDPTKGVTVRTRLMGAGAVDIPRHLAEAPATRAPAAVKGAPAAVEGAPAAVEGAPAAVEGAPVAVKGAPVAASGGGRFPLGPGAASGDAARPKPAPAADAARKERVEPDAAARREAEPEPERRRGRAGVGPLAIALMVLLLLAVVGYAYLPLIMAPRGSGPWGSDTWGHLYKGLYLTSRLVAGDFYPAHMPAWYGGLEPFRCWSPIPYYLLAVLRGLSGSIFSAGAWLVPLAAAFGGLSWLLYARRLGLLGATAAGLAWAVWPDHIRVALSEGNLPRAVATALLPILFLTFLDSLEAKRWPWSALGFALALNLIVLSHAMIAAIACVALGVFAILYWLFSGIRFRGVMRGFALMILALLLGAWWLIPSLTGGVAGFGGEAGSQATAFLSPSITFDPLLRATNPEVFYWGLSTLILILMAVSVWKRKSPLARSLLVSAALGIVVTFPWTKPVYSVLPLSHLLWPIRFASMGAIAVFVAVLDWRRPEGPPRLGPNLDLGRVFSILLAVVVLADAYFSLPLVHTREPRPELEAVATKLTSETPAWRVATLDLSRLGSEPAFTLTAVGGREQVFGWAWQGASIGPSLVEINTALETGHYTYVVDRAEELGATDLLAPRTVIDRSRFDAAASSAGFTVAGVFGDLVLYHKAAPPRAFLDSYDVLAVGKLAGNASLLFPAVETAVTPFLDEFDPATLARYKTVFLTGASWHDKMKAEKLVRGYVGQGGHVVVDLTGFPDDVLSKRPSFLGVAGEPVTLMEAPLLTVTLPDGSRGEDIQLANLSKEYVPWVATVPQGLDRELVTFGYYDQTAVVVGEKDVGGRPVEFVGMNLPYHALKTRDEKALALLSGLLGLEPGVAPDRAAVELADYRATSSGYTFGLDVPQDWAGRSIIVPVAAQDSLEVKVDGRVVTTGETEHLLTLEALPGSHTVVITAEGPPTRGVAAVISCLTALLFAGFLATQLARASRRRERGRPASRHGREVRDLAGTRGAAGLGAQSGTPCS